MAAPRVAMRNIKECLRLKFEAGLSHEKIARALQLSKGVVRGARRIRKKSYAKVFRATVAA